ncbi:alpha/beta fold hydrolase [Pseudonocardia sp. H11422]|uniref:alpha/beta fold hydrolase n=1 Tax=Pseudonocardia sp. H11422 TaxID=2835866 RepID=UPI001BDDB482|nr:alpha/beta hydrolase [Pseudonocardia sp. H11422]
MAAAPEGVTVSDGYIEKSDVRLHYILHAPVATPAAGSPEAVPIFVLPGITSPAATWNFVASPLGVEVPTYVLDQRGRGESDHPPTGYTLDHYADDAAFTIEALGLDRPVVVGHSMGGRVAMRFAARYPEFFRGVAVIDAPVCGPGRPFAGGNLDYYLDSIKLAKEGVSPEEFRPFHPTWTSEQLEDRLRWLPTCSEAAVTESFRNLDLEDPAGGWSTIRRPICFVVGDQSQIISVEEGEELAGRHPDCELVVITGAGHMIPWDTLDEFLDLMRRFHARVAKSD